MRSVSLILAILLSCVSACRDDARRIQPPGGQGGGGSGAGQTGGQVGRQPDGWDREVGIATPVDLNPDPHILEVNIEATVVSREVLPGTTTPVWTYNGQIPGPLLRAKTGDRVIVHFTNHLPEATTIHWHGVRLPAAMDGTPSVQPPVEPNATFDYDFIVPDAGLFWYHPHVRSNIQVANGLYGAIAVDEPTPTADFGDEVVLVLSDISVRPDGSLFPPDPNDAIASIWGREGNTIWVNGRVAPTIFARRGQRQRWHLVNAAGTRYFNLDLAGHRFVRIGGDGGLRETPIESDTLLVTPGERADVLVTPDAPVGTKLAVRWLPFDRGFGTTEDRTPIDILYVQIAADAEGPAPAPVPAMLRTITPVDVSTAHRQDIRLTLEGSGVYAINGKAFDGGHGEALHGTVGETDVWTITNASDFDHPFHLHGFFFQVLSNETISPVPPLEWKDTLNIKQWTTTTVAVNYDDRPGMWMFHCHILDHAELGLMGMLHVER